MPLQLPLHLEFPEQKSFEQYHGGVNAEAVECLRRCALGSGEPLIFLWGGAGLGKTHLLQACCRLAHQSQQSVCYLSFKALHEYGPAVLEGLENIQLVCLDDLESVLGDKTWEYGFFAFFNRLRDEGNRLIIAAHAPPTALPVKLADLRTRLAWGLTLRLYPLSDSDKLAALTLRAQNLGLELTPQVGRFLLTHYRRDLPSLWQLLEQLDQATLAAKRKLTIPFLKIYLEQ